MKKKHQLTDYPTLDTKIKITPFETPVKNYVESGVYPDSVSIIQIDGHPALLFSGHLPDPCCRLQSINFSASGSVAIAEISAWRDPDLMCITVLDPFHYVYKELKGDDIRQLTKIVWNDSEFKLKHP